MSIKIEGNIKGLGCYGFKMKSVNKMLYVGSGMMNDRLQAHEYFLKRGLYINTNKKILQKEYNKNNLIFVVLHYSANNGTYINGTEEERRAIQKSLETLEQFYVNLHRDTICNKMKKIKKWTTSPDKETTYKRKIANTGVRNPNNKYKEKNIKEIIWLKKNGYKPKQIEEIYGIKRNYINAIGVYRWRNVKGVKPDFII